MDRMLVVIFDRESKAYEGKDALFQLEDEGSIVIYDYAVIARNADGTARVGQNVDPRPFRTFLELDSEPSHWLPAGRRAPGLAPRRVSPSGPR